MAGKRIRVEKIGNSLPLGTSQVCCAFSLALEQKMNYSASALDDRRRRPLSAGPLQYPALRMPHPIDSNRKRPMQDALPPLAPTPHQVEAAALARAVSALSLDQYPTPTTSPTYTPLIQNQLLEKVLPTLTGEMKTFIVRDLAPLAGGPGR
jgi:hypothetical protein